jgi:hypothetical protein
MVARDDGVAIGAVAQIGAALPFNACGWAGRRGRQPGQRGAQGDGLERARRVVVMVDPWDGFALP